MADDSSEVQELLPLCSLFPLSMWPTAPAPVPSFPAGVLCNKMLFPLRVLPFLLLPGWGVMSRPIGTDICWTLSTPLGQAGFWLVVQKFMGFLLFLWSRWACGPSNPSTSFPFLGTQFIHCLCWDLDLKVIDECALQQSYIYIYVYSLGNMPDVQLTVVLLIQKPLLIELWNCFLDAACWNLWDSLFIGDDYLQRTSLAAK